MGNCCAAPEQRRTSEQFGAVPLPESPPRAPRRARAKSALGSFFSATPPEAVYAYEPGKEGAGVKRDLQTWEILPQLGADGVLDILHLLGSGGSGYTYLCRDVRSGELVAAKFISRPLSKSSIVLMLQEVELQMKLGDGHLGIVGAKELILTPSHLALVMEYAPGGNMAGAVAERWESALQRGGFFLSEDEARFYFRQVVDAVAYMHQQQVAHRDLKLDNTLKMDWGDAPRLKICDFGFAKRWTQENGVMHSSIGTPVYMSPQLLAARYGKTGYSGAKADVWAAGVLLYVMLFGCFPFDHSPDKDANSEEAHQEVWLGQQRHNWRDVPSVARIACGGLSREAEQLLDMLFEKDEDKRPTIADVALHPWVTAPLTPQQESAWARMQEQQRARQQELGRHGWAQVRARQEALLAMVAVASQAPKGSLNKGGSKRPAAKSCRELSVPHRQPTLKERMGLAVAAAAGAAASGSSTATDSSGAAAAAAATGVAACRPGPSEAEQQQQQRQQQQRQQPYLPYVAGKSDPSVRAELLEWGLEGQQQSLLDVDACPPDFHRRVSGTAVAYVGGDGESSVAPEQLLEAEGVSVPEVLQQVLSPVAESGGMSPAAGVSCAGLATQAAAAAAAATVAEAAADAASEPPPAGAADSASAGAAISSAAPKGSGGGTAAQEAAAGSADSSAATSVSADVVIALASDNNGPGDSSSPTAAAAEALSKLPEAASSTVWRLPLTRSAPVSAFKIPFPEYQVAAGALAKQLHQLGLSSHRLRGPSRSSWPLAAGIRPGRTTV